MCKQETGVVWIKHVQRTNNVCFQASTRKTRHKSYGLNDSEKNLLPVSYLLCPKCQKYSFHPNGFFRKKVVYTNTTCYSHKKRWKVTHTFSDFLIFTKEKGTACVILKGIYLSTVPFYSASKDRNTVQSTTFEQSIQDNVLHYWEIETKYWTRCHIYEAWSLFS